MDWISTKDRLAPKHQDVLVHVVKEVNGAVYRETLVAELCRNGNDLFWQIVGCSDCPWHYPKDGVITHWMPLPEPPNLED